MSNEQNNRHSRLVAIGIPVAVAIIGILGFVYAIGQRTNKIVEVVDWKHETAPRIERMDAKGTNSFEIFHEDYLRQQNRQDAERAELKKQIWDKEMADLKERILTLERKPCPCQNGVK